MIKSRNRILIYLLGLILIGFILLTIIVSMFPPSIIDKEFSEEVQEHQYPILDNVMKGISWFGYMPVSLIMVVITAVVFFVFKYKKESFFILLTLLSGLVSGSMKILVNRPRPAADLVRVVETAKRQSFPSGHVLFYVVFFGFIVLLMYYLKDLPKILRFMIGGFALFLVFTIPVSRIYLGAHWFTDVLGGFLLGMICLYVLSVQYLKK